MKELILKINAGITALLIGVVLLCLACAVEGNSPVQEWVWYAGIALAGEIAVWLGIGIGCAINRIASLPPMRRGYITFSEKYGWIDEGGRRP